MQTVAILHYTRTLQTDLKKMDTTYKSGQDSLPEGNNELVIKELVDKNNKVWNEIIEDAPLRDGIPCVSGTKIKEILHRNGFVSAVSPQSS